MSIVICSVCLMYLIPQIKPFTLNTDNNGCITATNLHEYIFDLHNGINFTSSTV